MADVYENQTTSDAYSEEDAYATVPTVTLQYINQAVGQPIDPIKQIPHLSIVTVMLADALITSAKIADAAIHSAHIDSAQIQDAHIDRASVNKLVVKSADIAEAQITNLHFDRASGDKIQILNGDIVSINASKINAGTINTSLVSIQGNNANFKITGDRLQIFDKQVTPVERVSIGDVNGDGTIYGFRVRAANGVTVLYDHTGVYSEGITNGAITNPKIGDDAVDGRVIAADSVTADHIVVTDLSAITANLGTVTAGTIKGVTIEGGTISTTHANYGSIIMSGGRLTSSHTTDDQNAELAEGTFTAYDDSWIKYTQLNRHMVVVHDTSRTISPNETYWSNLRANELLLNWGTDTQSGYGSVSVNRSEGAGWDLLLNSSGAVRVKTDLNVDSNAHVNGELSVTSTLHNEALLTFNTPRSWSFFQVGTDASSSLALRSNSANKMFRVQNSAGVDLVRFYANDTPKTEFDCVVESWAGFSGLGRKVKWSWNGTIGLNTSVTLTHNLGYYPIVALSGNTGNLQLTYSFESINTIKVYAYSAGGNSWAGSVHLF